MNDRAENNLSMLQAVNTYLGSPAGALLLANTSVAARRASLSTDLGAIAVLLGSRLTLTAESLGATAAKRLSRAEFNRLILKVSNGLVSAFTANNDIENATAVRMTKSKVTRTRDQDLPTLAALLTNKAGLLGSALSSHNLTPAEVSLLSTTGTTWGSTASKSTSKKSGSSASLKTAAEKITATVDFLKTQLDPLITTFQLSTVEAERTAAAGYFTARTVIDLHGPGKPDDPVPPVPPAP